MSYLDDYWRERVYREAEKCRADAMAKVAARLEAELKIAKDALRHIADMPVIDFCGDNCLKWQPSDIASRALTSLNEGNAA